jgi:hypothetical protein
MEEIKSIRSSYSRSEVAESLSKVIEEGFESDRNWVQDFHNMVSYLYHVRYGLEYTDEHLVHLEDKSVRPDFISKDKKVWADFHVLIGYSSVDFARQQKLDKYSEKLSSVYPKIIGQPVVFDLSNPAQCQEEFSIGIWTQMEVVSVQTKFDKVLDRALDCLSKWGASSFFAMPSGDPEPLSYGDSEKAIEDHEVLSENKKTSHPIGPEGDLYATLNGPIAVPKDVFEMISLKIANKILEEKVQRAQKQKVEIDPSSGDQGTDNSDEVEDRNPTRTIQTPTEKEQFLPSSYYKSDSRWYQNDEGKLPSILPTPVVRGLGKAPEVILDRPFQVEFSYYSLLHSFGEVRLKGHAKERLFKPPQYLSRHSRLEGPGKKKLSELVSSKVGKIEGVDTICRCGEQHMIASVENGLKGYKISRAYSVSQVESLLELLSEKNESVARVKCSENFDIVVGKKLDSVIKTNAGLTLFYWQTIMREVARNVGRKTQSLFYYSYCFDGQVIVILAGGPELKKSSGNWVKIITAVELLDTISSRSYRRVSERFAESPWIFVDANKLTRLSSCFDIWCSMVLTLLCQCEDEKKLGKIPSFLAACIMESRNKTCETLQHLRYMSMSSISPTVSGRYYAASKMTEQIRSPLQWYIIDSLDYFVLSQRVPNSIYDLRYTEMIPQIGKGPSIPLECWISMFYLYHFLDPATADRNQGIMKVLEKTCKKDMELSNIGRDRTLGYSDHSFEIQIQILEEMVERRLGDPNIFSDMAGTWSWMAVRSFSTHYYERRKISQHCKNYTKLHMPIDSLISMKSTGTTEPLKELSMLNKELVGKPRRNLESFWQRKVEPRKKVFQRLYEILDSGTVKSNSVKGLGLQLIRAKERTYIEFFMKEQYGVREIAILNLESRVYIYLLEQFSKHIISIDGRDTMNTGSTKVNRISDYVLGSKHGRTTCLSSDMKNWCQGFLMPQFIGMIHSMSKDMGSSWINFFLLVLLRHSRKVARVPKEIAVRLKRKGAETKPWMAQMKASLEETSGMFEVPTGMLQGILHYTSSLMHNVVKESIVAIFNSVCTRLGIAASLTHFVSSDDALGVLNVKNESQLDDARRAFWLSEICVYSLFGMTISPKTSDSILGEFNQCYYLPGVCMPPWIKQVIPATEIQSTNSTVGYINSCKSAIMGCVNAGAPLCVFEFLDQIQRRNFEMIFDCGEGGTNDPCKLFGKKREEIPHGYLVYPTFCNPLLDQLGPKLWDYIAYKKNPEFVLKSYSGMEISTDSMGMADPDKPFSPMNIRIGRRAPDKIKKIRNQIGHPILSDEYVLSHLSEFLRGKPSVEMTIAKIRILANSVGAEESLRRVHPLMAFSRIGASQSTNSVWRIGSARMSLRVLLEFMSNRETNLPPVALVFPRMSYYEYMVNMLDGLDLSPYKSEDPGLSYNVYKIGSSNQKLMSPLRMCLSQYWGLEPETGDVSHRDFEALEAHSVPRDIFKFLETRNSGFSKSEIVLSLVNSLQELMAEGCLTLPRFSRSPVRTKFVEQFLEICSKDYHPGYQLRPPRDTKIDIKENNLVTLSSVCSKICQYSNTEDLSRIKNMLESVKLEDRTVEGSKVMRLFNPEKIEEELDTLGECEAETKVWTAVSLSLANGGLSLGQLFKLDITVQHYSLMQRRNELGLYSGNLFVTIMNKDYISNLEYTESTKKFSIGLAERRKNAKSLFAVHRMIRSMLRSMGMDEITQLSTLQSTGEREAFLSGKGRFNSKNVLFKYNPKAWTEPRLALWLAVDDVTITPYRTVLRLKNKESKVMTSIHAGYSESMLTRRVTSDLKLSGVTLTELYELSLFSVADPNLEVLMDVCGRRPAKIKKKNLSKRLLELSTGRGGGPIKVLPVLRDREDAVGIKNCIFIAEDFDYGIFEPDRMREEKRHLIAGNRMGSYVRRFPVGPDIIKTALYRACGVGDYRVVQSMSLEKVEQLVKNMESKMNNLLATRDNTMSTLCYYCLAMLAEDYCIMVDHGSRPKVPELRDEEPASVITTAFDFHMETDGQVVGDQSEFHDAESSNTTSESETEEKWTLNLGDLTDAAKDQDLSVTYNGPMEDFITAEQLSDISSAMNLERSLGSTRFRYENGGLFPSQMTARSRADRSALGWE